MSDTNAQVDDIVAMLDGFMSRGGGHMNVDVNGTSNEKEVEELGCIDCAKGNLSCQAPTLLEGMDDYSSYENDNIKKIF
jgi:hypothetical protein